MIRTRDLGYDLADLQGEGWISVVVDPLQLSAGTYTVDVRITGVVDGVPLAHWQSPRFEVASPGGAVAGQEGCFVPHVAQVRVGSGEEDETPSPSGPTLGRNEA